MKTESCVLAGGIRATIEHNAAIPLITLTLCDLLRALTLALTPEQVAEMAAWQGFADRRNYRATFWINTDASDFVREARFRVNMGHSNAHMGLDDIAALRALAVAALAEEDR